MIIKKLAKITQELNDLERGEGLRGDKVIRFHNENTIRRALKAKFIEHNIFMNTAAIRSDIVSSNSVVVGAKTYNTMHVKVIMDVTLIDLDDDEEVKYQASGTASGDDFSNASATAITYAMRDWMRMQFQITYDPAEDSKEDFVTESVVLSEAAYLDCQLLVSRNLADLKKQAKNVGFKPSSWNVTKMNHSDLFDLSVMIVHQLNSAQGSVMDNVAEVLGESST